MHDVAMLHILYESKVIIFQIILGTTITLNTYCTCIRALRVAQLINEGKIQYLDSLSFCLDGFLDKCKKTADFVLKQRDLLEQTTARCLYKAFTQQDSASLGQPTGSRVIVSRTLRGLTHLNRARLLASFS